MAYVYGQPQQRASMMQPAARGVSGPAVYPGQTVAPGYGGMAQGDYARYPQARPSAVVGGIARPGVAQRPNVAVAPKQVGAPFKLRPVEKLCKRQQRRHNEGMYDRPQQTAAADVPAGQRQNQFPQNPDEACTTRVGHGPFPTELQNENQDMKDHLEDYIGPEVDQPRPGHKNGAYTAKPGSSIKVESPRHGVQSGPGRQQYAEEKSPWTAGLPTLLGACNIRSLRNGRDNDWMIEQLAADKQPDGSPRSSCDNGPAHADLSASDVKNMFAAVDSEELDDDMVQGLLEELKGKTMADCTIDMRAPLPAQGEGWTPLRNASQLVDSETESLKALLQLKTEEAECYLEEVVALRLRLGKRKACVRCCPY